MSKKKITKKKTSTKLYAPDKTLETVDTIAAEPSKTKRYLVLAFFVPFVIMGTMFAIHEFFPFGDKQFLVTDLWHQYFPFLSELQYKLQHGTSLLYDWGVGTGNNYLSLMAYYLASPLNFLTVFIPTEFLREAMTFFLLIKIGCSGLFFAIFLKGTFKRNDMSIVFFSVLYAMCAYTMGYYWNSIWFDTFALVPLVVYGTVCLVKHGKFKLYVIALALSLLTNYYIGFFTCIFTALVFFGLCITQKFSIKQFFRKLCSIALFSAIGLGLSTMLTIPAYIGLQHAYSATSTFPAPQFTESFINIFSKLNAMIPPNTKEGLPNIYCGVICVLLLGVFILSTKISLKSKIVNIAICAFLLVSFNLTTLNYIWHGFHATNMLPYRYSFLLSFVLIVMAYRAFLLLPTIRTLDIIVMGGIGALFIFFASFAKEPQQALVGTSILMAVYLLILFLYQKRIFNLKLTSTLIFAAIFVEMCFNGYIGVDTVGSSTRSVYPADNADMTVLVNQMKAKEKDPFYRAELSTFFTLNDSALYHFNGVSEFSSTVNASTTYYLEGLGLIGWDAGNRYSFMESSPFTSSLLDIKYLFSRNKLVKDVDNWSKIGTSGSCYLYENKNPLSLGFMTNSQTEYFVLDGKNPFNTQNDLFKKSTGLTDNLFDPIDIIHVGHVNSTVGRISYGNYSYNPIDSTKESILKWNYEMPRDGELFVYPNFSSTGTSANLDVICNKETTTFEAKRSMIFSVGKFKKGDLVSLSIKLDAGKAGTARLYAQQLNQDVWQKGYAALKDEELVITDFETTTIKGSINAKEDGLLYTSIPYEKGWTAYVDGVKTDITPIHDAVTAVKLTAGTHELTFKYIPEGFIPAVIITIFCLGLFLLIIFLQRTIKKKNGYDIILGRESIPDISTDSSTDTDIDSSTDTDIDSSTDSAIDTSTEVIKQEDIDNPNSTNKQTE